MLKSMNSDSWKPLLFASSALFLATSANAATDIETFTVDAEVAAPATTCTLTATNISFPPYDGSSNVNASGFLDVDCSTIGLSATIALGGVVASGGGDRLLDEDGTGTDTLTYSIADPLVGGAKWGDGTNGNTVTHAIVDDTGNAALNQLAMTATIPSGQTGKTVGTYSQTITATATF